MSEKSKNCFIKDCSAEPIVFCNCRSEQVFICKSHGILHCELEGKHHFSKIHIEIDKETRKATLKQLYKLKFDLQGYKSKIIQEELSLIKDPGDKRRQSFCVTGLKEGRRGGIMPHGGRA